MPSSDLGPDRSKSKGYDVVLTENTDDFIVGDRVWVYGTKPGYIQYLGETRFGSGDWAGVVLDDHSGKNDGSVAGVRYFQCEPKRGVFARLYKLTRFPITSGSGSPSASSAALPSSSSSPVGSNGGSRSSSPNLPSSGLRCSTPTRAASPSLLSSSKPHLGDRVLVNTASGATKTGVLRYWGITDFAAGEWAGVELDEPTGKNDGTVAGKKYFDCGRNYGLFAPAHKVNKATGSAASRRYQHHHHGSHDSLNSSLSSRASEAGKAGEERRDVEDEETSQETREQHQQKARKKVEAGGGVAAVAKTHLEQVQRKLSHLQQEHRRYVEESEKRATRLRQLLDTAETERRNINTKLEDERRKVEELQFRVDEERITKDDLELQSEKERSRVEDLELKLQEEKNKNKLLSEGKTVDSAFEELMKKQREEARCLREELREARRKIQNLETKRQREDGEEELEEKRQKYKGFEEEVTRREEQLLQMQVTLDNKKRELNSLQSCVAELEKEVDVLRSRQDKHLQTIDSLNVKLQKSDSQSVALGEELHLAKQKTEDAERSLASLEEKHREMNKEKDAMREQLSEGLAHDQISASLNRQLREKDRQLQELEWRLSERVKVEERLREDHLKAMRTLSSSHQDEIREWKTKTQRMTDDMRKEKERRSSKEEAEKKQMKEELEKREAEHSRLEARTQELSRKDRDQITKLRGQLTKSKAEADALSNDTQDLQRRLDESEERRRCTEEDRESSVAALKAEVHRLRSEFATHRQDLVKKLAETQYDTRLAEELQEQIENQRRILEDVQRRLRQTQGERDQLHDELLSNRHSHEHQQQEIESRSSSLQHELDVVKRRCKELCEENEALQRSFEATQILSEQRQQQIDDYSREQKQLSTASSVGEQRIDRQEKKRLENKIVDLQVELARLTNNETVSDSEHGRVKKEKEALENQLDFLQSVIVDMQKKNDDLRSRLEILETEVIFDGHVQLGDNVPRCMYCDLCGAHNLHQTSQCPKSKHSSSSPATHSLCEESEMF